MPKNKYTEDIDKFIAQLSEQREFLLKLSFAHISKPEDLLPAINLLVSGIDYQIVNLTELRSRLLSR